MKKKLLVGVLSLVGSVSFYVGIATFMYGDAVVSSKINFGNQLSAVKVAQTQVKPEQIGSNVLVAGAGEEIIQGVLSVLHFDDFENKKAVYKYTLQNEDETYTNVEFQDEGPKSLEKAPTMVELKGKRKGNAFVVKSKKEVRNISTISAGAAPAGAATVASFQLINSDTDQPIMTLQNGATLDLNTLPTRNLNVRAVTDTSPAYVRFDYDTTINFATDNASPYALAGDSRGNYRPWTPSVGNHKVVATAFSGKGKNVTATTPFSVTFTVSDSAPLATPAGIVATPLSTSQISIEWNDVAQETSYVLERKSDADAFTPIATLGQNIVRFTNTGLTSGTSYSYRVKAVNATGESAYSTVVTAMTLVQQEIPAAPDAVVATTISASEISLNWADMSSNEQGFKIERRTENSSYTQIATVGVDVKSYADTSVNAGTTYYYRIRSYNTGGDSLYSNETIAATPFIASVVPALNSRPGAPATLYLDFDGVPAMQWGSYNVPATTAYDTDGTPSSMSAGEIQNIVEMWNRVSEKFAALNINVSTVDPGTYAAGKVLRVGVGGDGAWTGQRYAGIAYVSSFTTGPTTVWAFSANMGSPKNTAEVIAHESGHGFGLNHISDFSGTTLVSEYSRGNSFIAPIMGASYYSERGIWWNGLNKHGIMQDDLLTISNARNAFGYRTDDNDHNLGNATPLSSTGSEIRGSGIIEKITDADAFVFTTGGGNITLNANTVLGATLDLKLQLVSANGTVVASADTTNLSESITGVLPAGTYYVIVASQGNYGDIGQYNIIGTIAQ